MMTVKAIAKQAEEKRDFYFNEAVSIFERIKKKIERANKKKSVVFKLYDVLDILNKNGFSTISAETEEQSKTERNSFVFDKEEALGFWNLKRFENDRFLYTYLLCVKKNGVYLEFPSKERYEKEPNAFVLSNYVEGSSTRTKGLIDMILDFWKDMSELGANVLKKRIDLLNDYECLLDVFLTTIDSFHNDYMAFAERQVK